MDDAAWRVSIRFADHDLAKLVSDGLGGADRAADLGGSFGRVDRTIYGYGPSRDRLERIVAEIDSQLRRHKITPVSVVVDEWLADDGRWSSDQRGGWLDSGGGSWVDGLIGGLMDGATTIIP